MRARFDPRWCRSVGSPDPAQRKREVNIVQTDDRHRHTDQHPAHLNQTESRQATGNTLNLRVVVLSLVLAVLAGLGIAAALYLPADRAPPVSGAPPKS